MKEKGQLIYLTKHFRLDEFRCRDGTPVPAKCMKNVIDLAAELELVRRIWKKPVTILSAYRTPAWNKQEGGVKNSQHLYGRAADIVVAGVPANVVADAIEAGIINGDFRFGGLGRYRNFTHVDIRRGTARWDET